MKLKKGQSSIPSLLERKASDCSKRDGSKTNKGDAGKAAGQPSISINGKNLFELYPEANMSDVQAFLDSLQKGVNVKAALGDKNDDEAANRSAADDWGFLDEHEESLRRYEEELRELVIYLPCEEKGKFMEADSAGDAPVDDPNPEPNVEACLQNGNIILGFHDSAPSGATEKEENEEGGFDWGRSVYNLSLAVDGAALKTITLGATGLDMLTTFLTGGKSAPECNLSEGAALQNDMRHGESPTNDILHEGDANEDAATRFFEGATCGGCNAVASESPSQSAASHMPRPRSSATLSLRSHALARTSRSALSANSHRSALSQNSRARAKATFHAAVAAKKDEGALETKDEVAEDANAPAEEPEQSVTHPMVLEKLNEFIDQMKSAMMMSVPSGDKAPTSSDIKNETKAGRRNDTREPTPNSTPARMALDVTSAGPNKDTLEKEKPSEKRHDSANDAELATVPSHLSLKIKDTFDMSCLSIDNGLKAMDSISVYASQLAPVDENRNDSEQSPNESGEEERQRVSKDDIKKAKKWRVALDEKSGRHYYYHRKTKEVSWVKPLGFDQVTW